MRNPVPAAVRAALMVMAFQAAGPARALEWIQPREGALYQRGDDGGGSIPVIVVSTLGIERIEHHGDDGSWNALPACLLAHTASARLPVARGGWLRATLRVRLTDGRTEEKNFERLGVGEIFVTAGQSNAANWGRPRQKTASGMTVAFDGGDWIPAVDPMPLADGREGSIWPLLGDGLAETWRVPVGFVCLGVGGSSVGQWSPGHRPAKGAGLYSRFAEAIPKLAPYGFRAVLWHQGETDRATREADYYLHLSAVIRGFREDFGDRPWMVAVVGNRWKDPGFGRGCRAAQERIIADGLALRGPDTDSLGAAYRLDDGRSSHFNQRGLEAHAALWHDALSAAWPGAATQPAD